MKLDELILEGFFSNNTVYYHDIHYIVNDIIDETGQFASLYFLLPNFDPFNQGIFEQKQFFLLITNLVFVMLLFVTIILFMFNK